MIYQVWGLATGRGSTSGAASGAFTWRLYPTKNYPAKDWKTIISMSVEDQHHGFRDIGIKTAKKTAILKLLDDISQKEV